MITGELKNKIDSLWDIFAAGGLTNPLDVIEQITYLMFIHDLDDKADVRGDTYRYLLAKVVSAGRNGQFRTPRHIVIQAWCAIFQNI